MILALVSLLIAEPAHKFPALPFAQGPVAQVSAIKAAIAECHAPAKVFRSGEIVTIIMAESSSDRACDCLSVWIANHPDTGFVRFGFIGQEQQ